MRKTLFLLSILCMVGLFSCTPDITTVQVIRNPSLSFNYNNTFSFTTTSYSFAPVTQTVVYPSDTTQPGQLYYRYILRTMGRDNEGNNLELDITFDAADKDQLVGVYTTNYSIARGLALVQLFNLTNNRLAAYDLCADNRNTATLTIQKQKADERLITGTFQMSLCDTRDTTEKITITNGVFTDITY